MNPSAEKMMICPRDTSKENCNQPRCTAKNPHTKNSNCGGDHREDIKYHCPACVSVAQTEEKSCENCGWNDKVQSLCVKVGCLDELGQVGKEGHKYWKPLPSCLNCSRSPDCASMKDNYCSRWQPKPPEDKALSAIAKLRGKGEAR